MGWLSQHARVALSRPCRRMIPNMFVRSKIVLVQKLVHSLSVDPSTHRVYAPEQEEDVRLSARIVVYETTKLRIGETR